MLQKILQIRQLLTRLLGLFSASSWTVSGVYLYLISLGLPIGVSYSNILISMVAMSALFTREEHPIPKGIGMHITLIFFILTSIASSFVSVDPPRSWTVNLSIFPAAIIFFVATHYFRTNRFISSFIVLTCLAAEINILFLATWITSTSNHPIKWVQEASLTYLATPNDLILVALIAPLTIATIKLSTNHLVRYFSAFSLFLSFLVVIIYRSNAALLVLLVGLTMMGLCLRRRAFVFVALLTGGAGILLLDGWQEYQLMEKMFDPVVWGNRIPLWISAGNMFLDAPLLGQGPGSFSLLGNEYMRPQALPDWVSPDPRHTPWPHNLYLELLAERGILGLISFMGVVIFSSKYLLASVSLGNETRVVALALISVVTGVMLAGLFELSILRHWLVILLALVCALTLVVFDVRKN